MPLVGSTKHVSLFFIPDDLVTVRVSFLSVIRLLLNDVLIDAYLQMYCMLRLGHKLVPLYSTYTEKPWQRSIRVFSLI